MVSTFAQSEHFAGWGYNHYLGVPNRGNLIRASEWISATNLMQKGMVIFVAASKPARMTDYACRHMHG